MVSNISWIRRGQRVIRMVSELHRMGYQLLRIAPYEYPLAWRCMVAPKVACSRLNGAFVPDDHGQWPTYSSASENRYFGWEDAETDDARALAAKFVARYADVAERGRGRDWEYAGWLLELLGVLERNPGLVPVVIAENFEIPPQLLTQLPLRHYGPQSETSVPPIGLPLPPAGMASDRLPERGASGPHGLSAALMLAVQPNYLGDPHVVERVISELTMAAVRRAWPNKALGTDDMIKTSLKVARTFWDPSAGYTLMPGWHTGAQLGARLVARFELARDPLEPDSLEKILPAVMARYGYQVGDLVHGFLKDPNASWERDCVPQVRQLQAWMVSVLVGTDDLSFGERTAESFRWTAAQGKDSASQ